MCSVMAQRASSLDFRGGGGGLEAEPVEIEKWVHLCREHMSYFFCLIGKGRFVSLRHAVLQLPLWFCCREPGIGIRTWGSFWFCSLLSA